MRNNNEDDFEQVEILEIEVAEKLGLSENLSEWFDRRYSMSNGIYFEDEAERSDVFVVSQLAACLNAVRDGDMFGMPGKEVFRDEIARSIGLIVATKEAYVDKVALFNTAHELLEIQTDEIFTDLSVPPTSDELNNLIERNK